MVVCRTISPIYVVSKLINTYLSLFHLLVVEAEDLVVSPVVVPQTDAGTLTVVAIGNIENLRKYVQYIKTEIPVFISNIGSHMILKSYFGQIVITLMSFYFNINCYGGTLVRILSNSTIQNSY